MKNLITLAILLLSVKSLAMTGDEAMKCELFNSTTSAEIIRIKNEIRDLDKNKAFQNIATIDSESKTCEQLVGNLDTELTAAKARAEEQKGGAE